MNKLITFLLSYFWNMLVELHKPVKYDGQLINTEIITRSDKDYYYLIEVKQMKYCRNPRPPFLRRVVYMYQVTQYVFKDKHIINTMTQTMPELCSFMFRNTKVPYVLAVNAFLEITKGEYNG